LLLNCWFSGLSGSVAARTLEPLPRLSESTRNDVDQAQSLAVASQQVRQKVACDIVGSSGAAIHNPASQHAD